MPPPAKLPDFFLDRSLGRIRVPELLRAAGLELVTLAERYGIPADESITDEQWLEDAGRRSEAVLMKDRRVRYRTAEKSAIRRYKVRCFCLARQDLTGDQMAQRFLANIDRIAAACDRRGPFLYIVHEKRIVETDL